MITSKPKHKIKRMLPDELPQPDELPESEEFSGEELSALNEVAFPPAESTPAESAPNAPAPPRAFKSAVFNLADPVRALRAEPPAESRPAWVRQVMDYVEREVPAEAWVTKIEQLRKLLRRAVLIEDHT